jgi:hypothetical protein
MKIRRTWSYWGGAAVVGLIALVILSASFRRGVNDTASLAGWAVALGTLALAGGTFTLAQRAAEEAQAVAEDSKQIAEQVRLQREQLEQSVRAHVFPWVPRGWAIGEVDWQDRRLSVLPTKNGGPGLALNVEGTLYWRNPGESDAWTSVRIYAGTIAPADSVEARLSQQAPRDWAESGGYLVWTDLRDARWGVKFNYSQGAGGQLVCLHNAPVLVENLDRFEQESRP